jgi:hypothetical protein
VLAYLDGTLNFVLFDIVDFVIGDKEVALLHPAKHIDLFYFVGEY